MSGAFGRGDEPERDAFGNEIRPGGHQWLSPQTPEAEERREEPPGAQAWEPPVAPPAARAARQTPGEATAGMILGILGVIFCPLILSVPAIVLGTRARREIDASGGALGGRGQAVAGLVLGWIGTVFGVLFLLLVILGALAGDSGSA